MVEILAMKVYCRKCFYFNINPLDIILMPSREGYCDHPSNVKKETNKIPGNYKRKGRSYISYSYKERPYDINKKNDCRNYKSKNIFIRLWRLFIK